MSDFDNRDEEEKKETGLEENKGKELRIKRKKRRISRKRNMRMFVLSAGALKARQARCTICPIISVSATTACTGLWMQ